MTPSLHLNDTQRHLLRTQIERALHAAPRSALDSLRAQRVLVTGASGFFGAWILLAFEVLNQQGWGVEVHALSRSPEKIWSQWPQWKPLADAKSGDKPCLSKTGWLHWVAGGFEKIAILPKTNFILHMAGSSDKAGNEANPFEMLRSTLDGATTCAQKAHADGARWLLTSSGAVYGRRTTEQPLPKEQDTVSSAPDPTASTSVAGYGHAKRMAEWIGAQSNGVIARPFAFMGPLLPLDWHFAAGNFLRDALTGQGPQLSGDGSPVRSYMHPADLASWLLVLLTSGQSGQAYNVGGEAPLSLWALAQEIAQEAGASDPQRARTPDAQTSAENYAPNLEKAHRLGLQQVFTRQETIQSWIAFHRAASK